MDSRKRFEAWWFQESTVDALENTEDLQHDCWIAWQAAERATAQRCAELCMPKNNPSDWTEYAKTRAECADAIRKEYGLDNVGIEARP